MSGKYIIYLASILLIVLAAVLIAIVILMRRVQGRAEVSKQPEEITGGSVSIFFDSRQNVIILPYIKDKYGVGRATDQIEYLNQPYSKAALGQVIRCSMKSCEKGKTCVNSELMKQLGYGSWREFSKDKRNISVHYKDNLGVIFNATRRCSDGSYEFIPAGNTGVKQCNISDEELGETIQSLLQYCRC